MKIDGRSIVLETAACCLCGSDAATPILTGTDRLHGLPGRFSVVRCQRCQLMRTNPRPTRETIHYYYPANYSPYLQTTVAPASFTHGLGRRLLDPLDVTTPLRPPGRLLELGSASGSFLAVMQASGWDVTGVEPNPESAARASAALPGRVRCASVENVEFDPASYDLICAWMTFEHLHDPLNLSRFAEHPPRWPLTGSGAGFVIDRES